MCKDLASATEVQQACSVRKLELPSGHRRGSEFDSAFDSDWTFGGVLLASVGFGRLRLSA